MSYGPGRGRKVKRWADGPSDSPTDLHVTPVRRLKVSVSFGCRGTTQQPKSHTKSNISRDKYLKKLYFSPDSAFFFYVRTDDNLIFVSGKGTQSALGWAGSSLKQKIRETVQIWPLVTHFTFKQFCPHRWEIRFGAAVGRTVMEVLLRDTFL